MLFDPRKVVHLTPFLLGLIAAPLALLLVGFFPITNIWLYLCLFLLLDVLLAVLSICLAGNKDFDPLIILCLATVGVLLLDTVTGGELQRYSVLSYDPMAGARYYGIGNEYMGILLGATIIGHALLLQRLRDYPLWPRVLVGLFFCWCCWCWVCHSGAAISAVRWQPQLPSAIPILGCWAFAYACAKCVLAFTCGIIWRRSALG